MRCIALHCIAFAFAFAFSFEFVVVFAFACAYAYAVAVAFAFGPPPPRFLHVPHLLLTNAQISWDDAPLFSVFAPGFDCAEFCLDLQVPALVPVPVSLCVANPKGSRATESDRSVGFAIASS